MTDKEDVAEAHVSETFRDLEAWDRMRRGAGALPGAPFSREEQSVVDTAVLDARKDLMRALFWQGKRFARECHPELRAIRARVLEAFCYFEGLSGLARYLANAAYNAERDPAWRFLPGSSQRVFLARNQALTAWKKHLTSLVVFTRENEADCRKDEET